MRTIKKKFLPATLSIFFLFTSLITYALPAGNYQQTCSQCAMHQGRLSCYCRNRDQINKPTYLNQARLCAYIENNNGQLVCDQLKPNRPERKKRQWVNAGPLFSQLDANNRCPNLCGPRKHWNGQWKTINPGIMSVCQCEHNSYRPHRHTNKRWVSAGPIINQYTANQRCENTCTGHYHWDGQWRTTEAGVNSVCECVKNRNNWRYQ